MYKCINIFIYLWIYSREDKLLQFKSLVSEDKGTSHLLAFRSNPPNLKDGPIMSVNWRSTRLTPLAKGAASSFVGKCTKQSSYRGSLYCAPLNDKVSYEVSRSPRVDRFSPCLPMSTLIFFRKNIFREMDFFMSPDV